MGTPTRRESALLPYRDPNWANPRCEDCGGALVWQGLECDPEDLFWDCPACIRAIAEDHHCAACRDGRKHYAGGGY